MEDKSSSEDSGDDGGGSSPPQCDDDKSLDAPPTSEETVTGKIETRRFKRKPKTDRCVSEACSEKPKRLLKKKRGGEARKTFKDVDLDRALYRWYSRRSQDEEFQGRIDLSLAGITKKALLLTKKFGGSDQMLKRVDCDWVTSWMERFGVRTVDPEPQESPEEEKKVTKEEPSDGEEDVSRLLDGGRYTDDQIYLVVSTVFDWTGLPDDSLGGRPSDERVCLLTAANRSGRHRIRILITGHQWRPTCLKHVNMLSQPVVYAGGGVGRPTPDLFTWWFHREFAPAALALNEAGALLVSSPADFLPADCRTPCGRVRLVVSDGDSAAAVRSELRVRYGVLLLQTVSIEQPRWLSVRQFLQNFTLRDAFPLLHKAWLSVRSEAFIGRAERGPWLELQWLGHELGLEVTERGLATWLAGEQAVPEQDDDMPSSTTSGPPAPVVPTASEAAAHLASALTWMESEPIEPAYLLVLRDILAMAKQASKMGLPPGGPGSGLPFFCHNGDPLSQPPPAHMGIPPYQLDPKAAGEYWAPHWKRTLGPLISAGLSRPAVYPFATGQYPYPMLSPEISQVAASWHTPSVYPIGGAGSAAAAAAAAGFRSPYPSSLPITTSALPSDFYSRFSPSGLVSSQHSGLSPAIVTPGPKQELHNEINHRTSSMEHKNSSSSTNESSKTQDSGHASNNQAEKKKPHIKKPLNAFMLYMKEMRAKVVAECTLKESAAINQILGRRWHALGREEQAKYYELARRERQLHMQLYPDWSSRSNTTRTKKRKRKQETIDGGNSMKKCRARYGLDQQSQWCKPCRRKKKCVRYKECGGEDGTQSEEGVGSCGSGGACEDGEDDDDEEEGSEGYSGSSPGGVPFGGSPGMPFGGSPGGPYGASSPGGLSALSSLTSPSGLLSPPSAQSLSPLTPHLVPPPPDYPPDVKPLPRPVGANPRDVNNPLSVNQLTAKCIKNSSPSPSNSKDPPPPSRTAISVP